MSEDRTAFQERIEKLWEEAKDKNYQLTQEEFAASFGATRNQLKGWISGAGEPKTKMLKAIAIKCEVSTSWLVGETDIRTPIKTIAAHRTDDPMDDLPPEALEKVEEFKELMRMKYGKKNI